MPRPSNLNTNAVPSNLPSEEFGSSEVYFWMTYFTGGDEFGFDQFQRTAIYGYNGKNWRLVVDNPITAIENSEAARGFDCDKCIFEGGYHWVNDIRLDLSFHTENLGDDEIPIAEELHEVWRSRDAVTWELSIGRFGNEEWCTQANVWVLSDGRFMGQIHIEDDDFPVGPGPNDVVDTFGEFIYIGDGSFEGWQEVARGNFVNEQEGEFPDTFGPPGMASPFENIILWESFDFDANLPGTTFRRFLIFSTDIGTTFSKYEMFPDLWQGFNKEGESAAGWDPAYPFRFAENGIVYRLMASKVNEDIAMIQIGSTSTPEDSESWEILTLKEVANFGRNSNGLVSFTPKGKRIFFTIGDTQFPSGNPSYRFLFAYDGGGWSEIELDSILGPLTGDFTLDVHIEALWYDDQTDTLYLLTDGTPNDASGSAMVFKCSGSSLGAWVDITPDWSALLPNEINGSILAWGKQSVWGAPAGTGTASNVNSPRNI